MRKLTRRVAGAALIFLAGLGIAPAGAFPASWKGSQFDAIGSTDRQAWLWDGSANGVPVRAHYGIVTGQEYDIYNGSGAYHAVISPVRTARINWTIICDDYPIGDDCSGILG